MYLSFDNTDTNPDLNPESDLYVGWLGSNTRASEACKNSKMALLPML